jgi:hypothetical protein
MSSIKAYGRGRNTLQRQKAFHVPLEASKQACEAWHLYLLLYNGHLSAKASITEPAK